MRARYSLITALTVSIALHFILFAFIAYTSRDLSGVIDKFSTTKPRKAMIKSYVYSPPIKKTPSLQSIINQANNKAATLPPIKPSQESTPKSIDLSTKHVAFTVKKTETTPTTQKGQIKIKDKPSIPFNPYKGLAKIIKKQEQQYLDNEMKQYRKTPGLSAMHKPLKSVPHRVKRLTPEQKVKQSTTLVGNETFIKHNGLCRQTSDLSFIDDNLSTVTSFSRCGETDRERYYREFMAKKLSKYQKN